MVKARVTIDFGEQCPAGHKVLQRKIDVVGLSAEEDAVRSYVTWRSHSVSMKAESDSVHDTTAIAVYGHGKAGWLISRKKTILLGHLPKGIAKQLAQKDLLQKAAVHLNLIDVGEYRWMSLCTSHVKISISVPFFWYHAAVRPVFSAESRAI